MGYAWTVELKMPLFQEKTKSRIYAYTCWDGVEGAAATREKDHLASAQKKFATIDEGQRDDAHGVEGKILEASGSTGQYG
jgi:hypothetical protein